MNSKSLKCFIIDDEPYAMAVIENFITRVPYLELIGKCENAIDALLQIQLLNPDIIFLDIKMPEMNGIDLIKAISPSNWLKIIIISAYSEYAINGYDYAINDYLLKPVSFERFMRAINKIVLPENRDTQLEVVPKVSQTNSSETNIEVTHNQDFFIIKKERRFIKIAIDEINFIESMKDYLKIYINGNTIIIHMTMQKVVTLLPTEKFIRISRSYLVKIDSISSINGSTVITSSGQKIIIGKTYKTIVWQSLKKKFMC